MRIPKADKIKNLMRPRRPEVREIDCLNCGAAVNGSYCANCGQATDVERYTLKGFVKEIYNQFRKIDGLKTVRTFWDLLITPAKFVRSYLDGKRVDHLGPIKYFFYSFVLQVTAGFIINKVTGNDVSLLTDGTDAGSQVMDLVATIFWGMCWWAVHRRSGMNMAENIVAALYFTAQTFMFTLLLRLIAGPLMKFWEYADITLTIADTIIYLAYSFYFTRRMFHENAWKTILKQLVLVTVYLIIFVTVFLAEELATSGYKLLVTPK